MRPAYITQMRSASPATTDRSCVIQISAVPDSRHSFCASYRICAWMVTSSAVVGSSAMMSSRLVEERDGDGHALAHAAGELVRIGAQARLGRRDADALERFARDPQRRLESTFWWARTASTICVSMRSTGLSVIIGSWNTIAMRAPRTLTQLFFVQAVVDPCPRSRMLPADDASRRVDQAEDGEAGHRLAAARLADQAEHFARLHREAHAVDRLGHAGAREEMRS